MAIVETFRRILAGNNFHPDPVESVRFLEGRGSEADLPEHLEPSRPSLDLEGAAYCGDPGYLDDGS